MVPLCVLGLLGFMSPASVGAAQCTLPLPVQGQWTLRDSTGTPGHCTVHINSTGLSGVTFWDKALSYQCYLQQGDYYVFVSHPTDLFEQYDVNVYFCWYLQAVSDTQFRLYELTGKVLYTIEERAKAFLNTSSPIINDVCEIHFHEFLTYKLMETSLLNY